MSKTVYLQGDDAVRFMQDGHCDSCLAPAHDWADYDHYGGVEVYGAYDNGDNLVGFLCPKCARDGEEP